MAQLGQYDTEERTVSLLQLYDRLASLGMTTGRSFTLGLTQQELADMLGSHMIHVNRTLSRLRARGLIMMSDRQVTLLDLEGLADLLPVHSHAPPAQEPGQTLARHGPDAASHAVCRRHQGAFSGGASASYAVSRTM